MKDQSEYSKLEVKGDKKVYLFGFSRWKQGFLYPFLTEYKKENIIFINPFLEKDKMTEARRMGLTPSDDIYIWGLKKPDHSDDWLDSEKAQITRIEDGFIRSVGLGSDLTQPYSLVVDDMGIYFDPTKESRLENIISNYDFDARGDLLIDASKLIYKIQEARISKYNSYINTDKIKIPENKTIKLVIGQVEDDASIIYGGMGMDNSKLLAEVKSKSIDDNSFIVYKPHPDVMSGNRIGAVPEKISNATADLIYDGNIHDILDKADEVHTITSLTGFEALIKNKEVFVYGAPFYSGWGLTNDTHKVDRRIRKVSLMQLAAATLILYPRYIDPKTHKYCHPDILIERLSDEREKLENDKIYRMRTIIRNYIMRYAQKMLTFFK